MKNSLSQGSHRCVAVLASTTVSEGFHTAQAHIHLTSPDFTFAPHIRFGSAVKRVEWTQPRPHTTSIPAPRKIIESHGTSTTCALLPLGRMVLWSQALACVTCRTLWRCVSLMSSYPCALLYAVGFEFTTPLHVPSHPHIYILGLRV